jgi:DNA-binding Lrp family transcriptional regulator
MAKAYVLITTDPAAMNRVAAQLRAIPTVQEAHEVMGPYDIVAEVEVSNIDDIGELLRERIRTIEGVRSTLTCVTIS